MRLVDDAVLRAEAVSETTEDEDAKEALTDLLAAYGRLQSNYNFVCAENRLPEPDPVWDAEWHTPTEDGEPAPAPAEVENGDRLLKVDEAAEILGVKPRWLYDRSDSLPFAKKLAPRTLRFSEKGMRRWLKTRP